MMNGELSQRAEPLMGHGVDRHGLYEVMDLAAPDLLTSKTRASILDRRDRYLHG